MDSLVAYASSDDDEEPDVAAPSSPKRKRSPSQVGDTDLDVPHRKKRKLPPLPQSLTPLVPESDPSKHQGRVRTQPHVEGQFASYVYVPVSLGRDTPGEGLGRLVRRVVKRARGVVPGIISIVEEGAVGENEPKSGDEERELHVSLSRPVYLRHHQRDGFKKAVRAIASSLPPFSASFAAFATFENDEKTRAFLALEVGAGHAQLHELAEALTPTLRALYQKEYYAQPRFHASIAWALLDGPPAMQPTTVPEMLSDTDATLSKESEKHDSHRFTAVREFPPALLASLTDDLGKDVRRHGVFDVTEIRVRIGKVVTTYPLRGH